MRIENIDDKFNDLYKKITNKDFLEMKALGGEIPFYITSYNPKQHSKVEEHIHYLKNRLDNSGIEILEINLYDICLTILEEKKLLEKILDLESSTPKDKLIRMIQRVLDIEKQIVPLIEKKLSESSCKVVFLTGVGYVYPYMRAHSILNNIQSVIKYVPMILFFPGEYNSLSLTLFGKLKDNNYYRAFNLDAVHY